MWDRLRTWLNDVPLSDPIERQQAPLLQMMLIGLIGLASFGLVLVLSIDSNAGSNKLIGMIVTLTAIVTYVAGLALIRRGRFAPTITLVIFSLLLFDTILLIPRGLSNSGSLQFLIAYPIAFAGLLARRQLLWLTIVLSILSITTIGLLSHARPDLVGYNTAGASSPALVAISYSLIIAVFGLGFDRFGSALRDALARSLDREHELERTRKEQDTIIASRTAELSTALRDVEQREAHLVQALADLRTSQAAVRELSAPVIPVLPGVLVAPLVGELDSGRAEALTINLLGAVEREQARHIIFDITGVPVVDTHVAQVLLQTTSAIRLLGARVLLVGVRPEVAQTIVSLGVDLGTIATYADLREAVAAQLLSDGWVRASAA
jgi:anti-anti-sigma factor